MTQKEQRLAVQEIVARCPQKKLVAMLQLIYNRQTASEQNYHDVKLQNNRGFTKFDARFLTAMAKVSRYKTLSPAQEAVVRKNLPKYWRQFAEEMNLVKEWKLVDSYQPESKEPAQGILFKGDAHVALSRNDGRGSSQGTDRGFEPEGKDQKENKLEAHHS